MSKARSGCAFIFLAVILFFESQGQIPSSKNYTPKILDPYYNRKCKSFFLAVRVNDADIANGVVLRLKEINPDLKSDFTSLHLQNDIPSLGGRHFTFEQLFDGMPVFNSQIKANLDKEKRIKSVFDNSWNVSGWNKDDLKKDFDELNLSAIENHFRKIHSDNSNFRSRKVIAILDATPQAVAEIELWDKITNEHLMLLADNSFNIFMRRDLNAYDSLETASALVFIPDPLTSAKKYYGAPYVDDDDSDVAVLNDERKPVTIDVTFSGGTYRLENQYARIDEFSAPDVAPAESSTPSFEFTRSQSGFEDVNALYHVTKYRKYVDSLGFSNLVSQPVSIDAHALNGADQSMFTDNFSGPQLFFGEGGVDDAEDADVLVHEDGHALSFSASPNTNVGLQRESVDEGLADYLATSYSKSIDTFRWADMFTWDGHNEYWNGRTAVTTKVYPADTSTSIHANGEIYNCALMKIYNVIGREKTDKLLLESLYGLAVGMNMKDAAMLLYDADTVLYSGENFCVIYSALLEKGLTDTFPTALCRKVDSAIVAKAGDDKTICAGDSIALGDASSFKNEYSYNWQPVAGLGSPLSLVTNASPTQTTTYVLTASQFSGSYNVDTVMVNVLQCDIKITNTEGFKSGGDLIITLPYNSDNNSIEVFDDIGKRILNFSGLAEQYYTLSGSLLPAGTYVIRVKSTNEKKSQKVVKVR